MSALSPKRKSSQSQQEQINQCYKCKRGERVYTPEPKQQALKFYVDGMSLRRIGRHLGIDPKTVGHWVNAHAHL